jgi:glycosyltransferase involved in cell wall biosynthesis
MQQSRHPADAMGWESARMRNDLPPILIEQLPATQRLLRVAVVTESYPPEVNGVAATAARFVEGLRARNHQIQLVRPRQGCVDQAGSGPRFEEVLTRGIAIPRYPNLKMGLPARSALIRLWTFARPDVVHIVTEGPLGWSALQAALKLKLPMCSDFRTNFHAYSRHYGVGWLHRPILAYLRKFHNRTQYTLVPTEALRAQLAALGFRNLAVVARGVDTERFSPARRSESLRASWGLGPQDVAVLHVGRIAPEKNLPALFAAFEAVRLRAPRARLIVVGDGPALAGLRAKYPQAVFAGERKGEELAACYASGDLFLFPSLSETWGNVTVEAMASGLAVIAFNYAAAAENITSGTNGMLVPYGDAAAFASAAAGLAGDFERMRAIGARARQHAATLSWERVVRELEAWLLAAAESGPGPRASVRAPRPRRAYSAAS